MKRFYCQPENIIDDKILLPAGQAHHIKNVLRLKKYDKITVFDGKGNQYNCIITNFGKKDIAAKIESSEFSLSKESAYKLTLVQALPNKKGKMDFIIEKATELGVDKIIPAAAERSAAAYRVKLERWQKIASEASRQCGRSKIPEIKDILSVDEALSFLSMSEIKLFACIDKEAINIREALKGVKNPKNIAVFIGPEGDFTFLEAKSAKEKSFKLVSLGERVLRTETAGLYVLSILDYVFG